MTSCLQKYVVDKIGCEINWFRETFYTNCSSFEEFEKIQEIWNWMIDATYDEFVNKTKCLQKCNFMDYEFDNKFDTDITWNTTKWVSEFYVYTASKHVEIRF